MKSLLVTGSQGFIGKNLISNKYFKNYKKFLTYNKSLKKKNTKNKTLIKINLLNFKEFSKLPKSCDFVIHLAGDARTFVEKNFEKKQIEHNTKITKNLLRYIKKTKCKKLIFLSSVYVYSGCKSKIYKENLELKPKEALGKSKLISENLIKNFVKKNDLCSYLLRAFTIYGTNSRKSQFLPMIIRQIQNKNLSKIVLKKPQIMRDFLHVDDLVEAIFLCLKYKNKKNLNIFNVASGKSLSVGFIVQKLIKISGKNKKLSILPVKQTISHVGDRSHYANIDKIKNQLTWEPKININRGLKKFYEQKQK